MLSSALVTAGYQVSRSHALAGSLKTNATRAQLHDIFRSWVKDHPVKLSNIKEGSPSLKLLAKEATYVPPLLLLAVSVTIDSGNVLLIHKFRDSIHDTALTRTSRDALMHYLSI